VVNRLKSHTAILARLALLLALSACGASPAPSPPPDARGCSDWPSRPADGFVSVDGASMFEVESSLATQGNDLAIAWEAYGCDDITRVGYVRRDPSGELSKPRYLASPGGQMASNVTVAFDEAGSLFAAWASWTPGPERTQPHLGVSDIHIQLARWPAGAADFEAPLVLDEPIPNALYDKPWMTVTVGGAIVVSYSDLRRGGIWVASSIDGGTTFQRTLVDPSWANLAASCADGRPGGAFLTYFTAHAIRVAHTADGGLTWSAPATAAFSDATTNVACQDPTCVANADQVWIAYGRTLDSYDNPVERLLKVNVAHFTLGGVSVAPDVAALENPEDVGPPDAGATPIDGGGPSGFVLFPQLGRLADGTLGLAAYRTPTGGPRSADLIYVTSSDGGASFSVPTVFATGLHPSLQRHVPDWLGDYFGWAPTAHGLGAAFIDNASGFSHIVLDEAVIRNPQP
jgi:hypothetical protein